ncbi:MAG: Ig-like domain-containing protein [Mucispirillum sp.]|nr:Ig-like domain-containing protein [Mucispirillum sp.]
MFAKKFRLKHFFIFVLSIVFSVFVYGCSGSGSSSSSSGGGNTPPIVVESISITNAPEYLDFNTEYQLEIDKPELNIIWDTSNQDLLEINNNGLIRAKDVAEGMVEITASYGDIKDVVSIYVKAPETPFIPVSSINIGVEELKFEMLAGEQLHLTSEVLPENATNKTVRWEVSDTSLANIDENGVLTANGENKSGKVTVTAKAGLQTASVEVTINTQEQVIPVQEVKITGSAEIMRGQEPVQFVAEVIPSDATFNKVTWKSSDEWVAVVDETGKVSASDKPGAYPDTAVITATAGGVSASYEVTVKEVPVKQVKITGYENVTVNGKTTLGIHDILQLQASILPADASCQDILWTSSDMEVALVDANGRVKNGNQTGPVTITAAAVDKSNQPCGEKVSVSIDVEFVPNGTEIPVSEIKIKGYDEMGVEGQVTFKAEFFPANATDNKVTWSSNNDKAVSIEQDSITGDAIITALAEAENVVITAAAGSKTAEYTIKTIRKVLHGYKQDENGVYLIYNRQGFSNCFYDIENKSFKLMTDLDFRGDETEHAGEIFDGTFDGNGHIIREYKVDDRASVHYGFVSVLGGTIMNVTFDTPVIRSLGITHRETYTGVVAGENNGTIKNVSINNAAVELQQVYADLSASAGLITGQSTGVIDNCTVDTGSLVIKFATSRTVLGGIAGINKGKIISSAANNINLTNLPKSVDYTTATGGIGGIAGVFSSGSYVKGSYVAGQITADDYAGGIAGVVEQGAADVSSSIFIGTVNSTGENTGLDYGSYTALANEEEVYVKNMPAGSTPKIKSPVTKIIINNDMHEALLTDAIYGMNKLLNKDADIHYLFKAGENEYEDIELMPKLN